MIIYKTTNLINGKIYIGKDSKNNPNYYGSGLILKQSIKKYGKENFKKEILEYCIDKNHLNEREIFWIDAFNSIVPNGYNITNGGAGGDTISKHPNREKICKKISIANKGHIMSDTQKKKISEANKGRIATPYMKLRASQTHKGKTLSYIHKKILSNKMKGNTNTLGINFYNLWVDKFGINVTNDKIVKHKFNVGKHNRGKHLSVETKNKIRNKLIGRIVTQETKDKLRQAHLGKKRSADFCKQRSRIMTENNPFKGKHHTDETKRKISNRPYKHGKDHHLFGKVLPSAFKSGKDHPRSKQITINGIEYGSYNEACKLLQITRGKLRIIINKQKNDQEKSVIIS